MEEGPYLLDKVVAGQTPVRSAEGTGPEWLKHESLGYCPIGLASFWTLLIDSIAYTPYIVLNQASYTLLF